MSASSKSVYDVIVVGGGAAGLMAAGRAAENGKRVLLLEKNRELGKKLKITGGGRCNITNAEFDVRELLERYGGAEQYLYSAFSQFGVQDTIDFFTERGLPIVVEAGKRAFPHTHKAHDVYAVLERYARDGGVVLSTNMPVQKVEFKDGMILSITADGTTYTARSYIFATGGLSHPETGSTGDGFGWLSKIGHTVSKPTPSIVPLSVKDAWVKELAGTMLTGVKITFYANDEKRFSRAGDILCTHFGMSGPLILNAAKRVGDMLHEGVVTARIDLFPGMDTGTLDQQIIALFEQHKNKMLKNVLPEMIPSRISAAALSVAAIDGDQKVHSVSRESRKALGMLLKAMPVTISGLLGFKKAVVADGGVSLSEIDTREMRSTVVRNLFVVGDLLNITRPSGGYSLQLCWTTGFVAGSHA